MSRRIIESQDRALSIELVSGGMWHPEFNHRADMFPSPTILGDIKLLLTREFPMYAKGKDFSLIVLVFFVGGIVQSLGRGDWLMALPTGIQAVLGVICLGSGVAVGLVAFGAAFVRAEMLMRAIPRTKAYIAALLGLPLLVLGSWISPFVPT